MLFGKENIHLITVLLKLSWFQGDESGSDSGGEYIEPDNEDQFCAPGELNLK